MDLKPTLTPKTEIMFGGGGFRQTLSNPVYTTPKKKPSTASQTPFAGFIPWDPANVSKMQFNLLGATAVDIGGERIQLRAAPVQTDVSHVVLLKKEERVLLRPDKL